jgi:hypothetical protein
MDVKQKECKANYRAKGFKGCGKVSYPFKFGLCRSCYLTWLSTTDEGLATIQRQTIKSKAKVKTAKVVQTRQQKDNLLSVDGYRKKYIQPKINELARLIDYGQPCIATGTYNGKMNGGHFIATGANRSLTYNLHNIHIQSEQSNTHQSGDLINYADGIESIYGKEYLEWIKALRQCQVLHLDKVFLVELRPKLKQCKELITLEPRDPLERIELRNKINGILGIYEEKQSFFKK